MVTQDAAILPKVNKMKVKKMKKKAKKKKMKGADNFDSESEADKLDLEQKMYPLSHYISDQEELVNQMFLTLSGSKLEAMLPPVLKSTPLTELKRLCIHELRGMSKKRILCCISGEVMEGSSGSEDEEDDKGEAAAEDSTQNDANTKGEKRLGDDQAPESYLLKKIKVEPGLEDSTGSGEGKSVLELLELEMRARIIKTMLEKGDEGKKITEDAIAAVMQSAKQITKEGDAAAGGGSKEATNPVESKDDSQRSSGREAVSEEELVEERSRGRRRTHGREGDRRRRHRPPGDSKRTSSRSRKRGSGSYSEEDSHGRSSKKPKEPNSSEKHAAKKKKITRKEFEERMKRAKKNRTYRQRKSSEDEEKTNENEDKPDDEKPKEDSEENTDNKTDSKTQDGKDGASDGNLTQDGAEREASEKEEGEIDSNEEEEGACSPTDMSSGSHYSSSSTYSRSRSRSYSRSLSRSPKRGRQRRTSRRSRSRSRKRRRSYSRSYSRSRSPEKRKGRGEHQKRSYGRKRSQEPRKSSSGKREVKKASPAEDLSPSREEDWGHKCDIEFVDSEEDFDDNPEATKKDAPAKKTVPVNRIERASISFSLQKKPVGIAQGIDLDDLPLKKKQVADNIEAVAPAAPVKKPPTSEEIVISSDSEAEVKGSTMGDTGQKQKSKEQAEKPPVTNITSSRLDGAKTTDINPQTDQGKLTKKTIDPETKPEPATKETQEDCTEDSLKLATNTTCEIPANKGVENTDKAIFKEESHAGDSKESRRSVDTSESSPEDTEDAPKDDEREHRDISPDGKLKDKSESLRTDPLSDGSVDSKGKSSDGLSEEREQDTVEDAMDTHISGGDAVKSDEVNLNETEVTEISFKKSRKRKADKVVNLKPTTALHSLEEEEQTEALTSSSTDTRSRKCGDKGVEPKDEDMALDSEREEIVEKSDSSETSAQKEEEEEEEEEADKDITAVHEDQSEDVSKATKKHKESEDEKEVEERVFRELRRRRRAPVDPIRIETGLIRRRVQPSRKIEMIVPEKSWMKREKKKKDKTKDVLAMEGVGLWKSTLSEASQSSPKDADQGMETTHGIEPVEMSEDIEQPGKSLSSPTPTGDTENSQPLQRPLSPSPKPDTSPETSQSEDKTMRKIDQDTEIIGVIETSKDASDNFDDMDLGGASWSMRWLQSEKVQKVVTSSKMLSRVRKKIQKKEKATKGVMAEKVEEAQRPSEGAVPVIGSIEEYERLFGTRVKKDEAAGAQEYSGQGQTPGISAQTQVDIPEVKDKGNPVFGSDDDGEDSEEEALWSKIIKK